LAVASFRAAGTGEYGIGSRRSARAEAAALGIRPVESADPNAIIVFPAVTALRPRRQTPLNPGRLVRRFESGARAWLALPFATALVLRSRIAAVDSSALTEAVPRLVPHAVLMTVMLVVVMVGGFARPDLGFSMPISTEQGHLTTPARLLLGPRAGEIRVRDSFVNPALSTTTLTPGRPRAEATTYVVQPGDTLWGIGAQFSVGHYSVMWSNDLDEDDIIKPGQELRIPPVPGALHVVGASDTLDSVAKRFNVDPAVIVDFNGLRPGEALTPDKLLVVPGGSLPVAPRPVAPRISVPARPVAPATRPATQAQARPGSPSIPLVPPAPAAPTGRFAWPTRGLITTYYSSWHPGIDIAAPVGTFIGASDGGTVAFAGWDGSGYGYRVIVNHGNGYSTTYNHLSVIAVRSGQAVGKGGQIGSMGSTGRSTGSHLHFEVLRNGGYLNPLGVLN
jgi:murein DD-endopeptidase MepM/ murein hydrolase activator NlpD